MLCVLRLPVHVLGTWDRYKDGPANNASYWPLDYPPLSGYQASGLRSHQLMTCMLWTAPKLLLWLSVAVF